MRTVLFIINPNSGTNRAKLIDSLVNKHLSKNKFSVSYSFTEYAGHAVEICRKEKSNYNIIVAVGGDGTIHEVAQALVHSDTSMGIIPMGSGNGFARFLNIPLNPEKAIIHFNKAIEKQVDLIKCNDEFFVNMAGIGFDAEIGHAFAQHSKRGGFSYIPLIYRMLKNYKPITLEYKHNNTSFTKETYLVSIANSSQWGMNAHIAPHARIDDGKFEMVILSPIKFRHAIPLATKLFRKNIHRSKHIETISLDRVEIVSEKTIKLHLDGEPRIFESPVNFQIHKLALKVFC